MVRTRAARRLDDGTARAGEAGYAPRPGSLPGHYDDEYVANDEPDYDDSPDDGYDDGGDDMGGDSYDV